MVRNSIRTNKDAFLKASVVMQTIPIGIRGVASLHLMGEHGQYIDPAQTFLLLTKQKANDPMMG